MKTDFRLIAATHVDLDKAMKEGAFREDLFYRLNVVRLRCRRCVSAPRTSRSSPASSCGATALRFRKDIRGISEGMIRTLQAYWWPGNIRELENLIERLVAITDKEWLTEEDLPFEFLFAQLDAQPESAESLFDAPADTSSATSSCARSRRTAGTSRARHGTWACRSRR